MTDAEPETSRRDFLKVAGAGLGGLLFGWFGRGFVEDMQMAAQWEEINHPKAEGEPQRQIEAFIHLANKAARQAIKDGNLASQGIVTGRQKNGSAFDLAREGIISGLENPDFFNQTETSLPVEANGLLLNINPAVLEQVKKVGEKLFLTDKKRTVFLEKFELGFGGSLEGLLGEKREKTHFFITAQQRAAVISSKMQDYCDYLIISVKDNNGRPEFTLEDWAQQTEPGRGPAWLTEEVQKMWNENSNLAYGNLPLKPNPLLQVGE